MHEQAPRIKKIMLNIFVFLLNSFMLKKIAERKINNTCKCLKLCESKKLKNIIVK